MPSTSLTDQQLEEFQIEQIKTFLDFSKSLLDVVLVTTRLKLAFEISQFASNVKDAIDVEIDIETGLAKEPVYIAVLSGLVNGSIRVGIPTVAGGITTIGTKNPAAGIVAGVVTSLLTGPVLDRLVKDSTGYNSPGDAFVAPLEGLVTQWFGEAGYKSTVLTNNPPVWLGNNLDKFIISQTAGVAEIRGENFTLRVSPATGKLEVITSDESFRGNIKNIDNLELLINIVKSRYGDEFGDSSAVTLKNSQTGAVTSFMRISKPVEQELIKNVGSQASTLTTLPLIQQNPDAKYIYKSQMPNFKLKTNEYNQAKKDNLQSGINAARSNGTLTNLGKQQSIDDQARRFIKAANIDRPEESLDGNRLFYMVAETGHEVVNDHGNYRNKTSFDLYTFDLTKSTQTVTHVPGDYNEVVYAQYAQYAQINQNVKTLWLNYQTQVSAALCQAA